MGLREGGSKAGLRGGVGVRGQMPEVALFRGLIPRVAGANWRKASTYPDNRSHKSWALEAFPEAFLRARSEGPGRRQEPPVCPHSVCDSDPIGPSPPWLILGVNQ